MERAKQLSTSSSPVEASSAGLNILSTLALVLVIIGGLNWALIGLMGIDPVAALFGTMTTLSRVVYVLVGAGAMYTLLILPRLSRLS